jgi:hypothetical protein
MDTFVVMKFSCIRKAVLKDRMTMAQRLIQASHHSIFLTKYKENIDNCLIYSYCECKSGILQEIDIVLNDIVKTTLLSRAIVNEKTCGNLSMLPQDIRIIIAKHI